MRHVPGGRLIIVVATAIFIAFAGFIISAYSQPPAKEATPESAQPAAPTYVGSRVCSDCHFRQAASWKKTKHAKEAFENVPAKYQTDPGCLKCHSTGYGQPGGFKDAAATPNLVGTTCEACHGPGSEHAKICATLVNRRPTPEERKAAHDAINKVAPKTACMSCHSIQGHREHPKYDKG